MIKNKITMYRYTGRQGFFTIPEKWCKECNLTFNLINTILEELGIKDSTQLIIRPWWLLWFIPLFRFGSFHAPQLIINDKLISAGVVPEREDVIAALNLS